MPPGWYPDPYARGRQLWWDGHQWAPPQPGSRPMPTTANGIGRLIGAIAAAVLVLITILVAVASARGNRSTVTATRPDGSPAGALEPEVTVATSPAAPTTAPSPEAAISRAIDPSVHVRKVELFPDGQVFVTWKIQPGGKTSWRAQKDATSILQGIRNSGVPITSARLIGKVDAVNQLGQTNTINGVIATYTAATIGAINFDQFNPENVFKPSVAQDPDVHPLLQAN